MPFHRGDVVFVYFVEKGYDIALGSTGLTQEGGHEIAESSGETLVVTLVDAVEEMAKDGGNHFFLFAAYRFGFDQAHSGVCLVNMLAVGVIGGVELVSFHGVGRRGKGPVE